MTVHYIAPWGSALNSGTLTNPWSDIEDANGNVSPGDVIKIRGGTYNKHNRAALTFGTSGAAITVQRYGTERPIIQAYEVLTGWSLYSGTTYVCAFAKVHGGVTAGGAFYDGIALGNANDEDSVGSMQCYYKAVSDQMFVNVGEDPSAGEVRGSQVSALRFSGIGNVDFRGIRLEYAFKCCGRQSGLGDAAHVGDVSFYGCAFKDIFGTSFQPMELGWSFEANYFLRCVTPRGSTNFGHIFYTGSDNNDGSWVGNIFHTDLDAENYWTIPGYTWHIFPGSAANPAYLIQNNLWNAETRTAAAVIQDNGVTGHTIKDNTFIGHGITAGILKPNSHSHVFRTSGHLVQGNKYRHLGTWNLEWNNDNESTFLNNKVWDCGYYSYDESADHTMSGTIWNFTDNRTTYLQFHHNDSPINPPNVPYSTARANWAPNAPWVTWTSNTDGPPTYEDGVRELLAEYPDHGYLLVEDAPTEVPSILDPRSVNVNALDPHSFRG